MMPVDRVLSALRERGCAPKRNGKGWQARCPAHDDRNPSLSIDAGDDGRALVKCHAGCNVDAVCGAMGIAKVDLFPDRGNGYRRGMRQASPSPKPTDKRTARSSGDARTFATASDAVGKLERRHGPRCATWSYTNASGEPVGLVIRWNTPTGKDVRPVSRKRDGSAWIIGGMPTPRPLYGLPALLATRPGDRVYVVEGEPAADAARSIGLTATTSPHGSKSAGNADWTPLAGREVVIAPDRDDAGDRYAKDVARLVTAAGAKSVRIVRLAELWDMMPTGGDIADLVERADGDAGALDTIRAEVEALAKGADAETVTPDAPAVSAYAPFPVDVLPEPVRSFVARGAKAIGCDPSYIALPLLVALAATIGNTFRAVLKRGWTEPAILWAAIVGDSGTMKTPAFKLAMRAIRKAQNDAFREYADDCAEYEAASMRHEVEVTTWKKNAGKHGTNDAGDPPAKPEPPSARRYVVSDTTVEALAPILKANPRGVMLARDELNGWIGSFDRYAKAGRGGADSAHWLSMHNGESMTIDRKTGNPPTIHVPSASVSVTGGIQPGTLARAMGVEHHENGLLARLLFAMPPRTVKRWTEADVDPASEAAVAAVFDRLFALTPDVDDEGDDRPRLVTLAPDAKRAWIAFYNNHAREQAELTGDLSAAWSKLEGYAARLALVIHLTRWAASESPCGDPPPVDESSIAAGVVLARWFGDEAKRVYAILSETDEERDLRELAEWIARKHGGIATVRDLTHGRRKYRGDPDGAERDLAAMVKAGDGRWEVDDHGGKGGRPAQRFHLLSAVTVTETRVNAGKSDGSGDGDTVNHPDDEWGEL